MHISILDALQIEQKKGKKKEKKKRAKSFVTCLGFSLVGTMARQKKPHHTTRPPFCICDTKPATMGDVVVHCTVRLVLPWETLRVLDRGLLHAGTEETFFF